MVYRCAHCLQLLLVDEAGAAEPCEAHPDGAIELIPDIEE